MPSGVELSELSSSYLHEVVEYALHARTLAEPTAGENALKAIRAQIEPLRKQAAASDPTALRRFGILPGSV